MTQNNLDLVPVALTNNPYQIAIGENVLLNNPLLKELVADRQVIIISQAEIAQQKSLDDNLTNLELLEQQLQLANPSLVSHFLVPNGESSKSLAICEEIYAHLITNHYDRKSILIALGGGVVGDLAGFVAATFLRGIDFIQIPTSLLAMVDSSIGGKTGVNHTLGKNLIGAFLQPKLVLIDLKFLSSLPDRELRAGLAEVIKYAILFDKQFFDFLVEHNQAILAGDLKLFKQIIINCCKYKAKVVINDEKEQGERALLNLGHTFGHAVENFLGYGAWVHGEAVALGLVLAAQYSAQHGELDPVQAAQILDLVQAYQLNYWIPKEMEPEDFIKLMLRDKKSYKQQINLILIKEIGNCYLASNQNSTAINGIIEQHKKAFSL